MSDMTTLSSKLSQLDLKSEFDIRLVLSSFSDSSASRSDLATSYASLARLLLPALPTPSPPNSDARRSIRSILGGWLSETSFPELGRAFAALSALLQTDLRGFSDLLGTDDLQAQIIDAADTLTISYKILDEAEYAPAKKHLAIFVAQASGFAATRALGRQLAGLNGGLLEQLGRKANEDDVLRAAAVVAGIKLQIPDAQSAPGSQAYTSAAPAAKPATFPQKDAIRLLKQLCRKTFSGKDSDLAFLVFEGLSLLSMKPSARRDFTSDEPFIKALIKRGSEHAYAAFSIATIFALLTAYHRPTSGDDRLKEKMRQYARRAGGDIGEGASEEQEQDESDSEIDERNVRLIDWGIVRPTALFARSSSAVVRRLAATILDGLVSKKDGRGTIIQQGGARALVNIIRASADTLATSSPPQEELLAVQILARLLITANPILVLGPGQETLLDLVRPIALLVTAPTASLLQHFEGLMALTNIAGLSEQLEDRIAKENGLLSRIEEILLEGPAEPTPDEPTDGRTLCRRAATELLCNIISCETVFLRYSALDQEERIRKDGRLPQAVASRLQVLVVLCDVDDAATRQAALGALAYLTNASTVCLHIASDPKRLAIILASADTDDDDAEEGVQIRATVILGNLCVHSSDRKQDCVKALLQLAQDGHGGAKAQAAEILAGLQSPNE